MNKPRIKLTPHKGSHHWMAELGEDISASRRAIAFALTRNLAEKRMTAKEVLSVAGLFRRAN